MLNLIIAIVLLFPTWMELVFIIDALLSMKNNLKGDDNITKNSIENIRKGLPLFVLSGALTSYFFILYFTK